MQIYRLSRKKPSFAWIVFVLRLLVKEREVSRSGGEIQRHGRPQALPAFDSDEKRSFRPDLY